MNPVLICLLVMVGVFFLATKYKQDYIWLPQQPHPHRHTQDPHPHIPYPYLQVQVQATASKTFLTQYLRSTHPRLREPPPFSFFSLFTFYLLLENGQGTSH